jgi:hypothetical protein
MNNLVAGIVLGAVLVGGPAIYDMHEMKVSVAGQIAAASKAVGDANAARDRAIEESKHAKGEADEANTLSKSLIDNAERSPAQPQASPEQWTTATQLGMCAAVLSEARGEVVPVGDKGSFKFGPGLQSYDQLVQMRDACFSRLRSIPQVSQAIPEGAAGQPVPQVNWPALIGVLKLLLH